MESYRAVSHTNAALGPCGYREPAREEHLNLQTFRLRLLIYFVDQRRKLLPRDVVGHLVAHL